MINSKQRATLMSLANNIDTIFQVGKLGITENLIKQVEDALLPRELIKLSVLETAPFNPDETARELASITGAEVVKVIGKKIILYRPNKEKPVIKL